MKLIVALFNRYEDAKLAIERLDATPASFRDVSIVVRQQTAARRLAVGADRQDSGAIVGGAPNNLNALLLGRQPINLPQIGSVIAIGPLGRMLRRSKNALKYLLLGAGLDEHDADLYHDGVRQGKVLMAVPNDNNNVEITALFDDLNPARVDKVDKGECSCTNFPL